MSYELLAQSAIDLASCWIFKIDGSSGAHIAGRLVCGLVVVFMVVYFELPVEPWL